MSEIQAILFPKDRFTPAQARAWLREHHNIPIKRAHQTKNYIRYRLTDPTKYSRYSTKITREGVELIIGYR